MLEVDFDDLDLGSKRKPTEWVAVLPPSAQQPRQRSSRQVLKAQKLQQAHKKAQEDRPQGAVKKQGIPVFTHAARMQQLAECTDVRQPRPISDEDAAAGAQAFPAENDEGNVEYKLRLKEPNCSPVRFQQLVTQMKYRLAEGNGECFYFIGDGYPRGLTQTDMDTSLATLRAMAEEVHAATTLLRKAAGTRKRQCAIVRVHKLCVDDVTYTDLRIAVAGSVDAGKSSLVGVLTQGIDGRPLLDNGCGSARMNVFQHKHEIETGRTSSLSQQMLGYDEEGKVLNYAGVSVLTPAEMSASARRVLRFIDLGGHEKYLKTALYGMTCMLPDYVLVCVCPLAGLSRVSHEHLAVALALEVPVVCVITKADIAPPEAVEQVLQDIRRVIGTAAEVGMSQEGPVWEVDSEAAPHVTQEGQAVKLARQLAQRTSSQFHPQPHQSQQQQQQQHAQRSLLSPSGLLVPIFVVSSVTGVGLPVLHAFLNALPALPHAPLLDPTPRGADPCGSKSLQGGTVWEQPVAGAVDRHQKAGAAGMVNGHQKAAAGGVFNGQQRADSGSAVNGHQKEGRWGASDGHPQADTMVAASRKQMADAGSSQDQHELQAAMTQFQVDHTFEVKGVGCVVSGTVVSGEVAVGQNLHLGPTGLGVFREVQVTCIHRSQVPVRHVKSGQHATVALHPGNIPLQQSQATQLFSQETNAHVTSLHGNSNQTGTALPTVGNNSVMAFEVGQQQQQFEAGQEQQQAEMGPSDAQAAAAMTNQQTLPAGLMSQALNAQAQTAPYAACQQQQDRYILDHRIQQTPVGGHVQQQAPATAAGPSSMQGQAPSGSATAVAIPAPVRAAVSGFSGDQGLHNWVDLGSNEQGAQHAQHDTLSNSPAVIGASPPNARKGMVLLDMAMHTRTVWEFEAVIVLLNGHWPPRGLLSGRWPPKPDTPDTVLSTSLSESPLGASDSDPDTTSPARHRQQEGDLASSGRSGDINGAEFAGSGSLGRGSRFLDRPSKKRQSGVYTPVIHCGSVRQAAQVMVMEEVRSVESASSSGRRIVEGCNMASAIAAAAVMQEYRSGTSALSKSVCSLVADGSFGDDVLMSGNISAVGTLTRVVFKFQHRPEWLMEGSRIIVRDRTDGCTAGAGVIRKLFYI